MKGKLLLTTFGLVLSLILPSGSIIAHHSTQGYTRGAESRIAFTGTVREFRWANPHAQLYLDETTEGGEVRTWGFELASPGTLIRQGRGWTHNLMQPGDEVTITFNPAEGGQPVGACVLIELADGRPFSGGGQGCGGGFRIVLD